jgi:hypothetical protein
MVQPNLQEKRDAPRLKRVSEIHSGIARGWVSIQVHSIARAKIHPRSGIITLKVFDGANQEDEIICILEREKLGKSKFDELWQKLKPLPKGSELELIGKIAVYTPPNEYPEIAFGTSEVKILRKGHTIRPRRSGPRISPYSPRHTP